MTTKSELIASITSSWQVWLGWACGEPAGLRNKTVAQLEIAERKMARVAALKREYLAIQARYTRTALDIWAIFGGDVPATCSPRMDAGRPRRPISSGWRTDRSRACVSGTIIEPFRFTERTAEFKRLELAVEWFQKGIAAAGGIR